MAVCLALADLPIQQIRGNRSRNDASERGGDEHLDSMPAESERCDAEDRGGRDQHQQRSEDDEQRAGCKSWNRRSVARGEFVPAQRRVNARFHSPPSQSRIGPL